MTFFLCSLLMVAGLVGIIVCAKKQKSIRNAQLYAILSLVAILASAGVALFDTFFSEGLAARRANANADQIQRSKLNAIAVFVNEKYDGKKVVILNSEDQVKTSGKEYPRIDVEKELRGYLKKSVTAETVTIKRSAGEEGEEDETKRLEAFNAALDACKEKKPDAVIILADLPQEPRALKIWKWGDNDPKVILLSVVSGEGNAVKSRDFTKGVLECAVMSKADAKPLGPDEDAPKDLKAAFERENILVTKDKFEELVKANKIAGFEEKKK